VQEDRLRAQERTVRAEEARIRSRGRELFREAERLLRRGKAVQAELATVEEQEQELEQEIAETTDPDELADFQQELEQLQQQEAALEDELARLKARAPKLQKQARALLAEALEVRRRADGLRASAVRLAGQAADVSVQAAELERQKRELEAQGAELARQGDELEQQGNELKAQGDELKAQGDQLQQQADELQAQQTDLEALQQEAQVQQQEAEELQDTLTTQLTKAGGDDRGTDPRVVALQDALTDTNGVQALSPPLINKSGSAAIFSLIPTTAPSDEATADLVVTLRETVIPDALATNMGIQAFVGGSTAGNVDLADEITSKLPLVIITVLGLSVIVLLLAFRSLLVPLQAALTNVVCVGASFGVLTACFQWGWGLELVGIDVTSGTDPIASYVPLMMFAVLFGLSMDYQVFLLSQVDLHRAEGENDHDAVRSGLALSARVITAAALIMIFVFGSFVLNGDPVVKQFGVGLAVAVALAALMVLLLSPALLVLLGRGTWWIPRWLDRLLPNMDIEGEAFRKKTEPAAPVVETPSPTRTGGS
jgi:multidrug efflux pump subunit AcrB